MIDIIFATSFSDLFQLEFNSEILSIDRYFTNASSNRKRLNDEKIRDRIINMMRLRFVSELSKRTLTDIRFYLENLLALEILKSVRRMFDASSSYLFSVVLPLVDEEKLVGPTC